VRCSNKNRQNPTLPIPIRTLILTTQTQIQIQSHPTRTLLSTPGAVPVAPRLPDETETEAATLVVPSSETLNGTGTSVATGALLPPRPAVPLRPRVGIAMIMFLDDAIRHLIVVVRHHPVVPVMMVGATGTGTRTMIDEGGMIHGIVTGAIRRGMIGVGIAIGIDP